MREYARFATSNWQRLERCMSDEIPEANDPLTAEELSAIAKLTTADLEIIDAAILASSSARWLKVARVVTFTAEALRLSYRRKVPMRLRRGIQSGPAGLPYQIRYWPDVLLWSRTFKVVARAAASRRCIHRTPPVILTESLVKYFQKERKAGTRCPRPEETFTGCRPVRHGSAAPNTTWQRQRGGAARRRVRGWAPR